MASNTIRCLNFSNLKGCAELSDAVRGRLCSGPSMPSLKMASFRNSAENWSERLAAHVTMPEPVI